MLWYVLERLSQNLPMLHPFDAGHTGVLPPPCLFNPEPSSYNFIKTIVPQKLQMIIST
jgi:hypothetical protein